LWISEQLLLDSLRSLGFVFFRASSFFYFLSAPSSASSLCFFGFFLTFASAAFCTSKAWHRLGYKATCAYFPTAQCTTVIVPAQAGNCPPISVSFRRGKGCIFASLQKCLEALSTPLGYCDHQTNPCDKPLMLDHLLLAIFIPIPLLAHREGTRSKLFGSPAHVLSICDHPNGWRPKPCPPR